ncbi:MAG: YebC/PmpR family DNA-binding transcriptional regulator [Deltaproteobacteria bacterium]|jgi:YebC/PmpR family DNA-binding regulatory protein|nr:YebC/PmpR family DNA-binding transcriptional regulator [Deltaproteobacteria bacterium]MDO9209400.1 YebC/PmpR family DNA-binding transcriptional regulator [Deltaproteobacteria bacterium]MDP3040118.1 YebC/PmpR family DNA-binding transcriptional regulator [Deltaproteobacteria bacterium]
MSGHSKWSTIKHKKGAADARRGKIFTKIIKEITIAARMGGGDQTGNPRLRSAILAAKAENMPKENIERAIKKGTGELPGVSYEEATFEGYGPGGVAVLVEILSDNRKRTVADIRHIFSKNAGNLGEAGCVSWMFDKKGLIVFEKDKVDEEKLMDLALEAGAQDVQETDKEHEVITEPADFERVKKQLLEKAKLIPTYAEISMLPQSTVRLTGKEAQQMLRLMESLEDSEDVQHVYANFDIPDEEMEKVSVE